MSGLDSRPRSGRGEAIRGRGGVKSSERRFAAADRFRQRFELGPVRVVLEAAILLLKDRGHFADGTVTLLADDDLRNAFRVNSCTVVHRLLESVGQIGR